MTTKKISCKDISEQEILDACRAFHAGTAETPDIALAHKYPMKVILRKMEKLERKGLIECGVSLHTAWVVADADARYAAEWQRAEEAGLLRRREQFQGRVVAPLFQRFLAEIGIPAELIGEPSSYNYASAMIQRGWHCNDERQIMNDRQAFINAIVAAPDDDAPRLVYADWLREQGDDAQADFIAEQVANPEPNYGIKDAHRRYGSHFAIARKLSGSIWSYLRDLAADSLLFDMVCFRRGFMELLKIDSLNWGKIADEAIKEHPTIRKVTLTTLPDAVSTSVGFSQFMKLEGEQFGCVRHFATIESFYHLYFYQWTRRGIVFEYFDNTSIQHLTLDENGAKWESRLDRFERL